MKTKSGTTFTALRNNRLSTVGCAVAGAVVLAALSCPAEIPAAAPDVGGVIERAAEALFRWDIPAARDALDVLPDGGGPHTLQLRSMVEFYSGNYEDALRLLNESARGGEDGTGAPAMLGIARDTLELSKSFSVVESEHFRLFLDEEKDGILIEPALQTLEAAYSTIGGWLGHHPQERVRVEIIPSANDFERVSSLTKKQIETAGAIGICKFNKIMLLSPRLLVQGYRWRDSLAHEYTHLLLVHLSANRAPIWIQEGVSRYGETLWRSDESLHLRPTVKSLIARALREEALVPFEKMDPSLVMLPTMGQVQLAFAECALAVDFIIRTWKQEGLRRLLETLAGIEPGEGSQRALRQALGVDLPEFETKWRSFLATQKFEEIPGLTVPGLKIVRGGEQVEEEWELERWQPMEARRHLRLGDMLRRRGRYEAGLAEYRRALKISPSSPYALNKAGRVYGELSRREEALEAFRSAISLQPDYPTSYSNLARLLMEDDRWAEARDALQEYLDINPFDPSVWKSHGATLGKLGDGEGARRSLRAALRLNPGDWELREILGER